MSTQLEQQVAALQLDLKTALAKIEMIANQPEPLSAWFSAGVALVAVITTALIAWNQMRVNERIKDQELRANVISQERREWGRCLRTSVANVLSLSLAIHNHARNNRRTELQEKIQAIEQELSLIGTLLDPDKDEHTQFALLCTAYYLRYSDEAEEILEAKGVESPFAKEKDRSSAINEMIGDSDSRELRERLRRGVQSILEENWRKIKNLE